MNLWFVRHGQTQKNKQHLLQGRSDMGLNETGKNQARQLGAWFKTEGIVFDGIYSSPLRRAVETAQLIAGPGADIVCDDRLLEMDYGPYEGAGLDNPSPELAWFFSDFVHHPAPPGMERLDQVQARAAAFLTEISQKEGENILVTTHAILLKGILETLEPESHGRWWSRFIDTCDVFRACCGGEDRRIEGLEKINCKGE